MTFRVLVTGSRDWPNPKLIHLALDFAYCEVAILGKPMTLVHGACPGGADKYAEDWYQEMKRMAFEIVIERHPAEWVKYGRSAGYRRNAEMVKLGADVCLAFIHNKSKGATHTANLIREFGIEPITYRSEEKRDRNETH